MLTVALYRTYGTALWTTGIVKVQVVMPRRTGEHYRAYSSYCESIAERSPARNLIWRYIFLKSLSIPTFQSFLISHKLLSALFSFFLFSSLFFSSLLFFICIYVIFVPLPINLTLSCNLPASPLNCFMSRYFALGKFSIIHLLSWIDLVDRYWHYLHKNFTVMTLKERVL